MKKVSLIVSMLLLSISNLSAENGFNKAVKSGTISGDVTLYNERQNNSAANADSGFAMGSIGLEYETGQFYGMKAALGFRGNHDFWEKEEGDYSDGKEPRAIMHTANISYTNKYFGVSLGRQEIDLEWMSDFHEAVVVGINAISNTSITLGITRRVAVADGDAPLEDFSEFDTNKNAYVLDAKYEGLEGFTINPYYYDARGLANWYGLKVDYDNDLFGLTMHGAKSDLDTESKDGQIIHLEGRTSLLGLGLSVGYIKTDKDQGIAEMDILGDNINPFEDGNYVYEEDAKTSYLNLAYELESFQLGAIYGKTKYSSSKEEELNLTLDYSFTDNLSLGLLYADINAENNSEDYNKLTLTLEYSF